MISQRTIKAYVVNQSPVVRSTFATLIGNNDEVAQAAIYGYLKPLIEYLKTCDLSVQDFENIQSLIDVYRGQSLQLKKKNKVLRFCFKWIVDLSYEKFIGISYRKLSNADQQFVGDALFLAALYRYC
jgi:hypothetical protein